VVVGKHSQDSNHRFDGLGFIWSGPEWGVGDPVPDMAGPLSIHKRPWVEVARLTDKLGIRQLKPVTEHVRIGVETGVHVALEAKAAPPFEDPALWEKLGKQYDALGHPKFMMTLTNIGHPVRRLTAAKAAGWQTAILPRGTRPTGYLTNWAPVIDAVWGPDWDPIPK
jgi:hypothetical protein